MSEVFSRTRLLLGSAALEVLAHSRVAVFGVGGVGGYVVEVLARSGIGAIDIIDNDIVALSNINRQVVALHSTVGHHKVDVAEERIHDINPSCHVTTYKMFYLPDEGDNFDFTQYDYIVDCIDTVTAKIDLARRCHELSVPILSCMGAANKMDPTAFRVTDLFSTNMDPLAKIMRKKLRKMGIDSLKVIYSEEQPMSSFAQEGEDKDNSRSASHSQRPTPASNAFVPAAAGIIAGGEVVKDLIRKNIPQSFG